MQIHVGRTEYVAVQLATTSCLECFRPEQPADASHLAMAPPCRVVAPCAEDDPPRLSQSGQSTLISDSAPVLRSAQDGFQSQTGPVAGPA